MYAFMYITYSFHGCLKFGKERNGKLFTIQIKPNKIHFFFFGYKKSINIKLIATRLINYYYAEKRLNSVSYICYGIYHWTHVL